MQNALKYHSSSQREIPTLQEATQASNKEKLLRVPVDECGRSALVTAARSQMTASYNLLRSDLEERINKIVIDCTLILV